MEESPSLSKRESVSNVPLRSHDLDLDVFRRSGNLILRVQFNARIFGEQQVVSLDTYITQDSLSRILIQAFITTEMPFYNIKYFDYSLKFVRPYKDRRVMKLKIKNNGEKYSLLLTKLEIQRVNRAFRTLYEWFPVFTKPDLDWAATEVKKKMELLQFRLDHPHVKSK